MTLRVPTVLSTVGSRRTELEHETGSRVYCGALRT